MQTILMTIIICATIIAVCVINNRNNDAKR